MKHLLLYLAIITIPIFQSQAEVSEEKSEFHTVNFLVRGATLERMGFIEKESNAYKKTKHSLKEFMPKAGIKLHEIEFEQKSGYFMVTAKGEARYLLRCQRLFSMYEGPKRKIESKDFGEGNHIITEPGFDWTTPEKN